MERITRRRWQIALVAALVVGALVFMYLLRSVFNPFLLALALSYILNPLINLLERRRVPRKTAVVLVFLLLVVGMMATLVLVVPAVAGEVRDWYIAFVGEPMEDVNGNGIYDAVSELSTYEDTNDNGHYDGPEPFEDVNGNGVYDAASEKDTWADVNTNGVYDAGESFTDQNANGTLDLDLPADVLADLDGDGVRSEGEPFRDINGNGKLDEDLGADIPGEDLNGNGRFDAGYIRKLAALLTRPGLLEDGPLAGLVPAGEWDRIVAGATKSLRENVSSVTRSVRDIVGGALSTGVQAAGWLWNLGLLLLLTPIYMGFLLFSMQQGWEGFVRYVPATARPTFLELAHKIDIVLGAFFRGRLLICVAIGAFTAIGFVLAGAPFGLVFGLIIGVASFIPFLNAVPLAVALLIAWLDGMGTGGIAAMVIVYGVGQGLDPLMMSLVVGKDLQLHPVTILLSLFACASLFGFFGMLLAVPIVAVAKILFVEFVLPHLRELAGEKEPTTPASSETPAP